MSQRIIPMLSNITKQIANLAELTFVLLAFVHTSLNPMAERPERQNL